ncbi:hypothetical protein JCGZ_20324 [Jatropha curcas]|uniref:Uncharacterized protein n=1 Tax=Jatropha curcas TaxID=180498 RepID=A0A067K4C4_JATCU|nr:hypothetical protein JCGZ_20324 [Jatropha curcas]
MESSSEKEKSKSNVEKTKRKEKGMDSISHSKEFEFRELLEFQGCNDFLSMNKPCYKNDVREFYGSLRVTDPKVSSMKIDGEARVLSFTDLSNIYKIPNSKSRVTKIKETTRV